MVGKNNHIRTIKSNLKEHYKSYKAGTRWIYASLASLALGAGILLGSSTTSYADVTIPHTQEPTETATNSNVSGGPQAKAVSLKSSVNTNGSANKTSENSQPVADSENADAKNNADPATSNTAVSTSTKEDASKAVNAPVTPSDSVKQPAVNTANQSATPAASQPTASRTLVAPTEDQLNAAKANADQAYATTHQPQEIDAVDPTTPATPTSLTISENAIGTGTNAQSPLIITLNSNANAGDVYQVTIPADDALYTFDSVDSLQAGAGTTTTTVGEGGSHIITDTFTTDTASTQQIKLNLSSPNLAPGAMADVGKTVTKNVTFTINNKPQPGVSFTQTVKPSTKLSTVTMLHPDPSTVEQLLPNQNYIFGVSVNESDGIPDDDRLGSTNRVSKVDNYGGSTITIPVPTGFTLDSNNTSKMNAFSDGTTITQPGGKGTNVIINVPAGAGSEIEMSSNGSLNLPEYQIAGAFDVPQTTSAQTLTANGNVTFSQIVNGDSANNTITDQADSWKVTIIPNQNGTNVGKSGVQAIAKGNSSGNSSQLVFDNGDDTEALNSFGFAYNSAADSNNTKITITVPNGLDATSIQTPAQGVTPSSYLPDTSSYNYTITLANGQTETGTVAAGATVTSADGSAIRSAVFEPNKLAAGSYTDASGVASSFTVNGHLAENYDDNTTPVKIGDKLTSTIDITFNANNQSYEGKASANQTVVEALAVGQAYLVTRTNSQTPGNDSAGTLQIRYNDFGNGQNTNKIYEPTFYFVLPKVTTVASVNSLGYMGDDPVHDSRYTADPTGAQLTQTTGAKVSEFTADNGQTVVKIDYSGTGTTVDLSQVTGHWGAVTLANDPDALPGNYPYEVYIVSPKTKLVNATKPTDESFVENNPNAYLMGGENGSGMWNISTASSFFNTSLAKGNTDANPVAPGTNNASGTSDDKGLPNMSFYDSIVYTSPATDAKDHNATAVINLPTVGDSKGSQYTFDLTGPIKVPSNFTTSTGDGTALNATVLYSTTLQTFNTSDTAPSTTGYVTADQVPAAGGWSKVRSIMIQVNGIKPNTSTGRIEIDGTVPDQTINGEAVKFSDMAGYTGYLQTAFYGDGSKVVVSSTDASIKIDGTSTVKARYHYVDADGNDQYVEISNLTQTVTDNKDTLKDDYPKQTSNFTAAETALIPDGYKLDTGVPTIIDSNNDGPAALGQVAQYFDDGDYVQYELVSNSSLTVTYVDNDNGNKPVDNPVEIDGAPDKTGTYDVKVPDGYELATGQADKLNYKIMPGDNDNDNLIVNLVHKHTTDLPDGFSGKTTRTITYTGVANGQNPAAKVQPITWTTDTDEVTGVTTYTPSGNYDAVPTPSVTGYKADTESVPAVTNKATTIKPENVTAAVTYTADKAGLTVTYEDVDEANKVVDTDTVTGTTDETGTYTAVAPKGYEFAKADQPTSIDYTITTDDKDNIVIPVKHIHTSTLPKGFTGTTTRTITYTGVANGQNPAAKVQPITWTTDTDEVTGDTTYTPSGNYYEVDTPRVAGYTPDKTTVPTGTNAVTTTKPVDANVTVIFKADPQSTTVEYVDDANNGAVVGTPTKLEGVTDSTASWNTDNKPAKYTLATGQAANGTYTFKAGNNAPVQIHLTHTMAYTTTTTTRTIHYVVNDPNYTGEVPAPTVQKATWNVVTDEVTGRSVATPTAAYYEQTAPDLTGYIAKPDKVAQQALGSVVAQDVPMYNEDVVVTYTPTSQPTKPGLPTTEPSVPSDGTGVPENQPDGNPTGTPTEPTTPGTPAPGTATSGKTNGDDSQTSTESGSNAGTAEGSTMGTTAKTESQNSSVSQTHSNASATNQQQGSQVQQKLPQTNEQSQTTVGLGVLGLLTSMLGLVGLKRRKRDDE